MPTTNKKLIQLQMDPFDAQVDLQTSALVFIDFQRDFMEENGFASKLGNDVSKAQKAIQPAKSVLEAARSHGLFIIHTREGHRSDMADLHPHKKQRIGTKEPVIGSDGPLGKILIRGEAGHDIISELYPLKGEPVIDKPGKGSFYGTDLEVILKAQGIETLIFCGVTTEVCVHTTIREANDRGFHCIAISDACGSYFEDFHETALRMIAAQHGIFGSVTDSTKFLAALES